jgi:excisionase family DNA binding protein
VQLSVDADTIMLFVSSAEGGAAVLAQEERREVLDVEGAAELLDMSVHAVRRLASQGRIPARKVGREWRFNREKLLRWVAGEDEEADG